MKKRLIKLTAMLLVLTLILPISANASFYILNGVRYEEPHQPDIKLLLDGATLKTDVPPVIVDGRTLVPVRSVFESMGAKVDWIPEERRVTVSGNVKVELVIDQKEANVDGESRTMDVPATIINDRTMVPVRFISECLSCDVKWVPEKRTVIINRPAGNFNHTLRRISYEWEEMEGRLRIALTVDKKNVKYNTFTLKEPNRLVLDLEETYLGTGTPSPVETECPMVPTIRYSQFSRNPMVSRVVVDLTEPSEASISKSSDGKTLYLDFQYGGDRIYLYDDPPTLVCGGAEADDLTLETDGDTATVTVSRMTYPRETLKFDNEFCSGINVTTRRGNSILTISLKENAEAVLSGNRILFISGAESDITDLQLKPGAEKFLVVIDPGHGGAEPGSIGYDENGEDPLYEKRVNLQIALRANTILKQMGVNTQMTRMTDTNVSLSERAEIANRAGADLFVSVHNNSFSSPDAAGSEVLYGSGAVPDGYRTSGKRLAQLIQKEMVAQLGRPDRGIKQTPGMAVIRLTECPAVIVECLFVSNPTDMAMLKDSEHIEKMAVAIARGVVNSLNEMVNYTPRSILTEDEE